MKVEAVSINGRIYSPEEAKVSAVDRGLMFGHGAFETFRVSNGKIFLLQEHFDRLDKNLKALDINWQYNQAEHLSWVKEIAAKAPDNQDARVRFCVTSGTDEINPNVIIYLSYINQFRPAEKPARIVSSVARHKPEYFATTGFRIKSLEYSYIYMARKELADDSTEGVLLNPEGYVAEALTSNIFWIKDGTIYTPPLSLGILAGTMRSWLAENFQVEEKLAKKQELMGADEIFLTAGASYLTAINQINGVNKPGKSGTIYKNIYQTLVDHLASNSQVA